MKDKPLVITHRNCFDGVTAAWAFRKFKGDDFDWWQLNFGDDVKDLPDTRGRVVFMADITLPRDVLIDRIILPSKRTTILDHHKTAQADLEGLQKHIREKYNVNRVADEIIFDMHRSGAGITWDYLEREHGVRRGFHSPRLLGVRDNWLVNAVEDRDIWTFKIHGTKEIIAYIATLPMTMEAWDEVYKLGYENTVSRGASIVSYIEMFGSKACKTARREIVAGHKVPTMNIQYMNCSDHLHKLQEENPDAPFVVGYFRRSDGLWQISFRSVGDFDVSEIAKKMGGGGHKNASGAQIETLPWDFKTESV
jgi:oligoribonuclease NrnB/cAMP/cGMP phosphodiesterase (DHH superfamily)